MASIPTLNSDYAPQERYLFKPFYGSSHWWALRELTQLSPGSTVLDIGAGSGAIGRELQSRGFSELFAVEIDPRAHSQLQPIYKQVETSLPAYQGRQFDIILLLDVVEHVQDCEGFFQNAVSLLKPGGQIIFSVPNIAHWSVRLPFIFGFLPDFERGILDRTHVQLFTRARVNKFLSRPGLTTAKQSGSIEPVEFVLPKSLWDNALFTQISVLRHNLAEILPGFFAYQHLAVVKRAL